MKRILLYDSLFFFGKGLQSIIESNFIDVKTFFAFGPNIAIEECNKIFYDVVIFDLYYDNCYNFQSVKKIKTTWPDTMIFILSDNESSAFKAQCSRVGVDFLLSRDCSDSYFIPALKLALYGNSYFKKNLKINVPNRKFKVNKSVQVSLIDSLSSREYEVASMMMKGCSNSMICQKLNLASTTISTYKKRILEKTNTSNIIEFSRLYDSSVSQ